MNDDEFIASFEDCSLAIASFHHADYVRVAFLYLCSPTNTSRWSVSGAANMPGLALTIIVAQQTTARATQPRSDQFVLPPLAWC